MIKRTTTGLPIFFPWGVFFKVGFVMPEQRSKIAVIFSKYNIFFAFIIYFFVFHKISSIYDSEGFSWIMVPWIFGASFMSGVMPLLSVLPAKRYKQEKHGAIVSDTPLA